MNKVIAKEIKEGRKKEKELKWLKNKIKFGFTTNQATQRVVKKRAQFIVT
jgi:nickel-dependent lactate racemase